MKRKDPTEKTKPLLPNTMTNHRDEPNLEQTLNRDQATRAMSGGPLEGGNNIKFSSNIAISMQRPAVPRWPRHFHSGYSGREMFKTTAMLRAVEIMTESTPTDDSETSNTTSRTMPLPRTTLATSTSNREARIPTPPDATRARQNQPRHPYGSPVAHVSNRLTHTRTAPPFVYIRRESTGDCYPNRHPHAVHVTTGIVRVQVEPTTKVSTSTPYTRNSAACYGVALG